MNKPLRIGLVLPAVPGYSETFFRSKIKGLQAVGHKVDLFVSKKEAAFNLCPVWYAPPIHPNAILQSVWVGIHLSLLWIRKPKRVVQYYRLERKSGRNWRKAIENLYLNSHILSKNLDWLHFGFATMGLRRENAAAAMHARMAISLRGYDIAIYPLKFPGCYQLLWKRVDKVHTISDDLLELAYRNGLPASTPVQKITPAIDSSRFQRESSLSSSLHQPLKVLTVARLHWKKGLEYTLEALALLAKLGIDFQYTLIGAGEDYERLVFAAHQFGISEKVYFVGKKAHDSVKAVMEDSDLYLQYSISEGFCNAALEAQALGLLCIVSDAEGLPENILHEQTGWVVPKMQPELLVEQIIKVIQSPPEQLLAIRRRAIERVRQEFDIRNQIQKFIQFYEA